MHGTPQYIGRQRSAQPQPASPQNVHTLFALATCSNTHAQRNPMRAVPQRHSPPAISPTRGTSRSMQATCPHTVLSALAVLLEPLPYRGAVRRWLGRGAHVERLEVARVVRNKDGTELAGAFTQRHSRQAARDGGCPVRLPAE